MACNEKRTFFTSEQPNRYNVWSCQKMSDALHYLVDNLFIRFDSKLYRQIVGMLMGTNCAPFVADLCLFCYEIDFMLSLSENNQADVFEAFNSTSRYPMVYVYNLLKLNTYRRIQSFSFSCSFSFFLLYFSHKRISQRAVRTFLEKGGGPDLLSPLSGSAHARHMEETQR